MTEVIEQTAAEVLATQYSDASVVSGEIIEATEDEAENEIQLSKISAEDKKRISDQYKIVRKCVQGAYKSLWDLGDAIVELQRIYREVTNSKLNNEDIVKRLKLDISVQRVSQIALTARFFDKELRSDKIDFKAYEVARQMNESNKVEETKKSAVELSKLIKATPEVAELREALIGKKKGAGAMRVFKVCVMEARDEKTRKTDGIKASIEFDGKAQSDGSDELRWKILTSNVATIGLAEMLILCAKGFEVQANHEEATEGKSADEVVERLVSRFNIRQGVLELVESKLNKRTHDGSTLRIAEKLLNKLFKWDPSEDQYMEAQRQQRKEAQMQRQEINFDLYDGEEKPSEK